MKSASPVLLVLTLILVVVLAVSFMIYVSSLGKSISNLNPQNSQSANSVSIDLSNIKVIDNTHSLDPDTVKEIAKNTALFLYSFETKDFDSVKDIVSANLYKWLKSAEFYDIKIQSILQITVAQVEDLLMAFAQVVLEDREYGTLKIEPEIEFIKAKDGYLIDKILY